MKNYVQPGNTLTIPAVAAAVVSGQGLLVGSMFGVVSGDAAIGEDAELQLVGVFDLAKVAATAIGQGVQVYWDDTAKNVTSVSTSNTLIGVAAVAAATNDATIRVRLNGSF